VRFCRSTLSLQWHLVVAAYLPVQHVSSCQDIQELMQYKEYKWWKMRYSARLQSSTWRVVYLLYVLGRWFSERALYLEYTLFRKLIRINYNLVFTECEPGKRSLHSDSLGAGRFGNQIPHQFRQALSPPSLLYKGYRVLGQQRPSRGVNHQPPSSA